MYISSANFIIMINRLLFINNTALGTGCAVSAANVYFLQYSGVFLHNSAQLGGAILLLNATAVAKDTLLMRNYADFAGGGIGLISQSTLRVQSEGTNIQGNTAPTGGAVFLQDSNIVIMQ